jgi:hypothetical protein
MFFISLMTGKMVPVLARVTVRTKNFELCATQSSVLTNKNENSFPTFQQVRDETRNCQEFYRMEIIRNIYC